MTDLVKALNEVYETTGKGTGKITRQRLRQEEKLMKKELRSARKENAMLTKKIGGGSTIRSWREMEVNE